MITKSNKEKRQSLSGKGAPKIQATSLSIRGIQFQPATEPAEQRI